MEIEGKVLKQLGELSVEHLKLVHTELGLTEITDEAKKESSSYIRKMIMRHLSSDDVADAEDEGLSTYLHLDTFMETLIAEDPKDSKDEKPADTDSATEKKADLTGVTDQTPETKSLKARTDSDKQKDVATLEPRPQFML